MDWLPQWAQVSVGASTVVIAVLGVYWRLVIKVAGLKARLDRHEDSTAAKFERLGDDMAEQAELSEKLLAKAESRDAQFVEQGTMLTKVTTALDIQLPAFAEALKTINTKLDNLK